MTNSFISGMRTLAAVAISVVAVSGFAVRAADTPTTYSERAPLMQYLAESADAEIALARSAAPASVADNASVMILESSGYRTASKGTNGFVCMVWRSWSDDLADIQFWNPKVRAPICLNPIAVRTVLPGYLMRTQWVLSGLSREQMQSRFAKLVVTHALQLPAPGAMSYMMSRQGYLADDVGHASPPIMFWVPRKDRQDWAANLPGSPIWGAESISDPVALFFVVVGKWSDGAPAMGH